MNATPRTEAENDAAAEASAEAEGKNETNDKAVTTDKAGKADKTDKLVKGEAKDESAESAVAEKVAAAADADVEEDADDDDDDLLDLEEEPVRPVSAAAPAAAIVSAGLALSAITGTWTGTILGEREKLDNQLHLTQASDINAQLDGLYGNVWHMTALVNGSFALLALLVGVGALIALRPATSSAGAAVAARPVWMRALAWGGVILAILGLLVSAGMYLDLFAAMPTPPAAPTS
ncbi:hypothetical protein ACH4SP_32890 [Streptomyces sp. NPDC021093]|uniref:hypothetical protein n=1 Tax=Streptomyces sp. NPDC021093 TaxID=3365112 RepID=UPI0037AEF679